VNFLRLVAVLLCSAIVVPSVHAQSDQKDMAEQKGALSTEQPGSYPDTADGLRDLIRQLVKAVQQNESQKVSDLTHSLIVPNYRTWFLEVFGAENGASVVQLYEGALPDFDANFKTQVERYLKEGMTGPSVERIDSPGQSPKDSYSQRAIKAMQSPVPIYSVSMSGPAGVGWTIPGFFTFVQGNLRYVEWHALSAVPNLVPSRIRLSGSVMQAKTIHQVPPVYPSAARNQHIQGTVVLHAVINYDGSINALQLVSGPLELAQSAMDAVKLWRYQPTLLNGERVQVDTTISVTYSLGGR
jgi:TonB family protein